MGKEGSSSCIWVDFGSCIDHNMIAGEVVEELSRIDFEKSDPPLRVLTLSNNQFNKALMIWSVTI